MLSEQPCEPLLDERLESPPGGIRDIGFGIEFWPFNWQFGAHRTGDILGRQYSLHLGPFTLTFDHNPYTGIFGKG